MALDIVLVVLMAVFFYGGLKRGFVRTLIGLVGFFASSVAAFVIFRPVSEAVKKIPQVENAIAQMAQAISKAITPGIKGNYDVPAYLSGIIGPDSVNAAVKTGAEQIAFGAAGFIADVAILILLILAIKLAISIVLAVSSTVTRLPVIRFFDKVLGGGLGLIYGVLAAYIVCAGVFVLSAVSRDAGINNLMQQSLLAQYFYAHNIFIDLFLKKPPII